MSFCSKCGLPVTSPSSGFCPICANPLLLTGPGTHTDYSDQRIPWESVEILGIVQAVFRTLRETLFSPSVFFNKITPAGNPSGAFVYALVLDSLGSIFSFFWTYVFFSLFSTSIPWLDEISDTTTASIAGLIFLPLILTIKIFFATGYFHTLLKLTRTRKQNIKSTFVVICYAESAAIFNLIPFAGSLLSLIWSFVLLVIGFSRVHCMSARKASVIILLPLLILAIIVILAVALIIGAIALFQGFQ
jgi:hypothetical protein